MFQLYDTRRAWLRREADLVACPDREVEIKATKNGSLKVSQLSLDLIEEFLAQCSALLDSGLPSPAGLGKWEKNKDYFRMDGATTGGKRHEFINR